MRTRLVGFGLSLCLLNPLAQADEPQDPLADQLAEMNRTLEQLVTLLETVRDHQRVDLVLKRIELADRRIAPLETKLRNTESAIEDAETQIKRFESMLEQTESVASEALKNNDETKRRAAENEIDEIERVLKMETARLESLRQSAVVVENELASSRKDIEDLDDLLREMLE